MLDKIVENQKFWTTKRIKFSPIGQRSGCSLFDKTRMPLYWNANEKK